MGYGSAAVGSGSTAMNGSMDEGVDSGSTVTDGGGAGQLKLQVEVALGR